MQFGQVFWQIVPCSAGQLLPSIGNQWAAGLIAPQRKWQMALEIAKRTGCIRFALIPDLRRHVDREHGTRKWKARKKFSSCNYPRTNQCGNQANCRLTSVWFASTAIRIGVALLAFSFSFLFCSWLGLWLGRGRGLCSCAIPDDSSAGDHKRLGLLVSGERGCFFPLSANVLIFFETAKHFRNWVKPISHRIHMATEHVRVCVCVCGQSFPVIQSKTSGVSFGRGYSLKPERRPTHNRRNEENVVSVTVFHCFPLAIHTILNCSAPLLRLPSPKMPQSLFELPCVYVCVCLLLLFFFLWKFPKNFS